MTTDKEKLKAILEVSGNYFEDILLTYFRHYEKDFSATRLNAIVQKINEEILTPKIEDLQITELIAYEKANYLKLFLEGKMYTNEEAAKANIQCQIKNANDIIERCK